MKEEWLFPGAVVPVDVETTAALVAEIKRLIDVVGGMALAKPEQEPVAWLMYKGTHKDSFWLDKGDAYNFEMTPEHRWEPLYTTPPAPQRTWVGLTDEELRIVFGKLYPNDIGILELAENNRDYAVEAIGARHHWTAFKAGAKAGEAKLKEKNSAT